MAFFDRIPACLNHPNLQLGWADPDDLAERVADCERSSSPICDEQLLTFICVCAYALVPDGPQRLARILLQDPMLTYSGSLWFEFIPPPTRRREGGTHVDLSFGHLSKRGKTASGVQLADPIGRPEWIALVEAKLYSDIACDVEYDPFRNQFLRLIETAAAMQRPGGQGPDSVHVVLITPEVFRQHPKSRFYGCKFEEYCSAKTGPYVRGFTADVNASRADLDRLRLGDIKYTLNISERLQALKLHWVTYEEVIRGAPEPCREELVALVDRQGSLVNTAASSQPL